MKDLIKNITPPILWNFIKTFSSEQKFNPQWNTLTYGPMKGVRIFFDPAGKNWQTKMVDGSYDSVIFDRFCELQLTGKVVYDIGAHIGFHSLYFARLVGNTGKVVSFEPNAENVKRLKMNVDANSDLKNIVSVYETAVSDHDGTEKMMIHNKIESGRSMGNFLKGSNTLLSEEVFVGKGFQETEIKTIKIDSVAKEFNIQHKPDVIKIDVEGAEYKVLIGAKETLQTCRPILFIEIHSIMSMFNVTSLLRSLNYDLKILKKEKNGICFMEASPIH